MAVPFLAMLDNSGSQPWYESPWAQASPQEEYERALLEPYGGVTSREQFEQIQSGQTGQGGPDRKGLIADVIEQSSKRSFGDNAKIFAGGVLNPGKAIGSYYSESISKYIMNGGVVLLGVIFLIGAFMIFAKGQK